MATPFVLVALTLLVQLVRLLAARRSPHEVFYVSLPLITRLLFILYPLVTNVAFEAFSCYELTAGQDESDGVLSWLVADVSIRCSKPFARGAAYHAEHAEVTVIGFVAVGIYAFGLIAFNGALLFAARKAIVGRTKTRLSRSISFLHREFEPTLFWWELVEMSRRLVLVGFFILLQRGSVTQIIAGATYSLVHLLLQMQANPYRKLHDNFLANACNFCLCALCLCLMLFKIGSLIELPEVQAVISTEQTKDYHVDSLTLTLVLLGSVVASLVACIVILIGQIRKESARLRQEARTSKARRLRCAADDSEVVAPQLEPKWWHLFLSHVWGTGQVRIAP